MNSAAAQGPRSYIASSRGGIWPPHQFPLTRVCVIANYSAADSRGHLSKALKSPESPVSQSLHALLPTIQPSCTSRTCPLSWARVSAGRYHVGNLTLSEPDSLKSSYCKASSSWTYPYPPRVVWEWVLNWLSGAVTDAVPPPFLWNLPLQWTKAPRKGWKSVTPRGWTPPRLNRCLSLICTASPKFPPARLQNSPTYLVVPLCTASRQRPSGVPVFRNTSPALTTNSYSRVDAHSLVYCCPASGFSVLFWSFFVSS